MEEKQIILFDGVCNLCNGSVNFIIDRDSDQRFVFAPLQEERGQQLQLKYGLSPEALDSVVLIKEGKVYKKSTAALEIAKQLDGWWKVLYIFKIVPAFIRDMVYDMVARNRYRWFGRADQCRLPTPELRARFV
jgi:predicted DCC family thiol-disulfide oxidoreductase YuxK